MNRIETFTQYLQTHPNDRFARYSLALALWKDDRPAEAEAQLRALLSAHPDAGPGYFQLGRLLEALDRPEEALATWRAGLDATAAATDPDAARTRNELRREIDRLADE